MIWNKNEAKLTCKQYAWHKATTPITAESICQLPVVTMNIEEKYRDTGGIDRTVPEEHFFFRKTLGEWYADISPSRDSGNKLLVPINNRIMIGIQSRKWKDMSPWQL